MSHPPHYDLDVRPILNAGGEPFSAIMNAVARLAPGQGLRLLASFKPVPLFDVLGARGFEPSAREIGNGDWEVVFTPVAAALDGIDPDPSPAGEPDDWPAPAAAIDCRDLPPPEPMVRTMEAVEALPAGETLVALVPREPRFLYPELDARGHRWRAEPQADGSYRIVILRGSGTGDP